jgi:hypothetical protein
MTSDQCNELLWIQVWLDQISPLPTPLERLNRFAQLRRASKKLHRLSERYCNGELDADRYVRQSEPWEEEVKSAADGWPNVEGVEFNGDPRGWPIRLLLRYDNGSVHDIWIPPW